MIAKIGQCQRCVGMIYLAEEVGLRWTADLEPLDAQAAVQALVGGREVYRVTQPGPRLQTAKPDVLRALREAEPGERPVVVANHPCPTGAARALKKAEVAPEVSTCPKGPEKPVQGAARGRSAEPATSRRTSDPVCDTCGVRIGTEEQMVGIQLGELYVYANHADRCP